MSDIEATRAGDVVTITLNRPAKRNAITTAMYLALETELDAADTAGAAVVVLTGAGGAFTAGMDLQDLTENAPLADDPPGPRFLRALTGLRAVLVAAVDGPAVGVGATMLLHCDLVYATERSIFSFPFVNLGLVPEAASTLLLPQLTGHQRAAELMLFGEKFDARAALAAGMLNAVVSDAEALAELVADRTRALAAKPHAALLATRAMLRDHAALTVPDRLALDRIVFRDLLRNR